MLNFDASKAPVSVGEFNALVKAVVGALDEDEADWLEWKSTLTLDSAPGKVSVARCVVALANRLPDVAAGRCEGRGYLVVGASPGGVAGTRRVDPQQLDSWWRPLLGSDGPSWRAHWVVADEKDVLVVEVAPPRPGDPIHAIRKSSVEVADGDIFVRRAGSSERASSAELRQLELRSRTEAQLSGVEVSVASPKRVPRVSFALTAQQELLDALRREATSSLRLWEQQHARETQPSWPFGLSGLTALSGLREAGLQSATDLAVARHEEDRTPEQYLQEVEAYVQRCERQLPQVLRGCAGQVLPPLVLRLRNMNVKGIKGLRLEVHVPGRIEAAAHRRLASNEARLPNRPRSFGPWTEPRPGWQPPIFTSAFELHDFAADTYEPGVEFRNGGSVDLSYDDVDLRAHTARELAGVVLLVDASAFPADAQVVCSWTATAENLDGVASGTFCLTTGVATYGPKELLAGRDRVDSNDER